MLTNTNISNVTLGFPINTNQTIYAFAVIGTSEYYIGGSPTGNLLTFTQITSQIPTTFTLTLTTIITLNQVTSIEVNSNSTYLLIT